MRPTARRLVMLVLCAAGLFPVTAAQAQWQASDAQRPPPLYPYELQPGQSYAVEVAPGTYVIHHPSNARHRRALGYYRAWRHDAVVTPRRTHANRKLIEELRRRDARRADLAARRAARLAARRAAVHHRPMEGDAGRKPDKIIHTRETVRDKPVVIETRRVVEDPPRVITRRHYVDDLPLPRPRREVAGAEAPPAGNRDPRVIHADAEITILGPDRMSIRLVRKNGQRLDLGARLSKRKKRGR